MVFYVDVTILILKFSFQEPPTSKPKEDDDIVRCVPHTIQADDETDHTSSVQKTPLKSAQTFPDFRSPFRSQSRSPHHFNTSRFQQEKLDIELQKERMHESLEQLKREYERRNARKQLNFDTFAPRSTSDFGREIDELYYNTGRSRSPKFRRSSTDSDDDEDSVTSELISQLLTQLQSRKRKVSDRRRCEYDDDCDSRDSYKRRRKGQHETLILLYKYVTSFIRNGHGQNLYNIMNSLFLKSWIL